MTFGEYTLMFVLSLISTGMIVAVIVMTHSLFGGLWSLVLSVLFLFIALPVSMAVSDWLL
jgi:hypothetical protein